jgi:hypothetical protein
MKKLTKIQWINIIVYSFFALYFIIPWKMIFLQHHKKTCGFVYLISTTRHTKYAHFSYQTEDKKWMTNCEPMDNFSVKKLDSLKKMGCIKIIYSTNFNSWTKITDKRLLIE